MGLDINQISMRAKETFIDKELDKVLEESKNYKGPLAKVIEQVIIICLLQGAQGRHISRNDLAEILPKILETAELTSSTYKGRTVWLLAGIGAAASVIGGAYGAAAIPAAAANANDALSKALIAAIEKKCAVASGVGQFFSQSSSLYGESEKGPRELLNHKMQDLNFLKEKMNQASQTADGKISEHLRALQQLYYSIHQIYTQIFSSQT